MAYAPNKPLPPWLTKAVNAKQTRPNLDPRVPMPKGWLGFEPVIATFVTDHSSNTKVEVTRVTGSFGFNALIFFTPLNEDLDGAPDTYAPPVTSADTNHSVGGLHPRDHINNATNQKPPVFHDNGNNTYLWAGVVSMTPGEANSAGRHIDQRNFLKDHLGRFPVFGTGGFYAPRTAINTRTGNAVNPLEVPYAALSSSLRDKGGVRLGDFGLAIRASKGSSSAFIYADAGGQTSTSVGECSRKLIRNLFGGPATSEKICYIVFPGSRRSDHFAEPELMEPVIKRLVHKLNEYENAEDLFYYLISPWTSDWRDPRTSPLLRMALATWGYGSRQIFVPTTGKKGQEVF